ncbi:DUF4097 family beta strand repeat-containing protein [Kutzneria albida]|uniref:DUF4097 domain-containing protein n=1 Tax=Kutzneria albida DSM 43870 TaxID=1449976 RepID=W5W2K3_9PSEU|nr:DUF4097 family beta strand repeat-containing protein [Kutzneria albida]AHH95030.1 hypothetical protein KALB_1658 [Kutzneria albida DSM 43870]
MPTFATPSPIPVTITLGVGYLRITASDRTDTVVEVRPTDPSRESDIKAARQTRVEHVGGTLLVKAPKSGLFGKPGSVDVTVELPSGSQVHATTGVGDFRSTGRLGECTFSSGTGRVQLDSTGPLHLTTSGGEVAVERVEGDAQVSTGTGVLRVRAVDGSAVIKNANGDSWLGEVTGDLRASAANGDITVGRALGAVNAKTANGNVRLGEVVRGSIALVTACGELEVGVREGSAAWLDLSSQFGAVHNDLDTADGPGSAEQTVEVRARTSYGDILIRRS